MSLAKTDYVSVLHSYMPVSQDNGCGFNNSIVNNGMTSIGQVNTRNLHLYSHIFVWKFDTRLT